jgi:hypothetical protein
VQSAGGERMTEREEQAVIVLNTLYNNPLLSDIHRQALEVGIMAIKAESSSEKPNKWIACSDRLPDTLKDVIIAFANEPDEYDIAYLRTTDNKTYIANGSKKEWVSSMGETTYAEYEVDAWMPIIPYQPKIQTQAEGSDQE